MQKQDLILIGGGGHCKSCINVIEQTGQYTILGILDQADRVGTEVLDYKIIGTDDDLHKYNATNIAFLITIGQVKSSANRKRIFEFLITHEMKLATIIAPTAHVSKYAKIGRGTIVMHNVNINAEAIIGENCILNTGCNIEHDVTIGNHTHISTLAVINGGCNIGANVFVGSNATVANNVNLSHDIIIGSGAVVIKTIHEKGTYVGNPIKKIN